MTLVSRLHARLIEPPSSVVGSADRRRGGLLAILQLTQSVQLVLTTGALAAEETGTMRFIVPAVMAVILTLILASYGLLRAGDVRRASWLYLGANVATTPAIFLAVGPTADFEPFVNLAFLLPAILLANTISSARTTLLTGFGGLMMSGLPMYCMGPVAWHRPIQHGLFFVLANMGLVLAFGVHRDRVEADRSAELRSRNEELEALRRTLETRVQERTAALTERDAHSRLVLDHVSEGVFTVDAQGRFVGEPSAALVRWFGAHEQGTTFYRYFGAAAPRFAAIAACAWDQVMSDLMPLDVSLAQLPSSFAVEDRHYTISYDLIDAAAARCFLVVVSDVTAERQREQFREQSRERVALFDYLQRDRGGFIGFIEETKAITNRMHDAHDLVGFARDVHTLKGNALSLGLESLGRACHAIEERLATEPALPGTYELAPLTKRWSLLLGDAELFLGAQRERIEVSQAQYVELERAAARSVDGGALTRLVAGLKLEPLAGRLGVLAEQTRRIAARLEKATVVEVIEDGTRIDGRRWAGLWAAMVHPVRNALDHGIESAEARLERGKPSVGSIQLRARTVDTNVVVEIEDDGAGIDTDALAQRLGRAVAESELLDVLCAHGISTASSVTDMSGRGVGMGALRAVVEGLGGVLTVDTRRGRGTLVRMSVPAIAAASQPRGVAA